MPLYQTMLRRIWSNLLCSAFVRQTILPVSRWRCPELRLNLLQNLYFISLFPVILVQIPPLQEIYISLHWRVFRAVILCRNIMMYMIFHKELSLNNVCFMLKLARCKNDEKYHKAFITFFGISGFISNTYICLAVYSQQGRSI